MFENYGLITCLEKHLIPKLAMMLISGFFFSHLSPIFDLIFHFEILLSSFNQSKEPLGTKIKHV